MWNRVGQQRLKTALETHMADEPPIHETTTEARAGDGNPVNRYVLYASLVLVVIAFIVILAVGWE
jgi:Flp pilus assembly protein TadB